MVVSFQRLLMPFGNQLEGLFKGVGAKVGRSAALGPLNFDGLAKAEELNFILTV